MIIYLLFLPIVDPHGCYESIFIYKLCVIYKLCITCPENIFIYYPNDTIPAEWSSLSPT